MDVYAIVVDPLKAMFTRLYSFLPVLLGALLLLLVGWIAARIIQQIVVKGLKAVRIDDLARQAGFSDILGKGAVPHTFSELIGVFLYWLVMLSALVTSVNALGLNAAAELLERLLSYIPSVLAGIIVLVLGIFFSAMLGSLVQTITANAGIKQARLLGQLTKVVVVIFSIEVALEKFIGTTTLHVQLNIIVAAIAFGTALAFGLGCKDLAGRFASDLTEKLKRG